MFYLQTDINLRSHVTGLLRVYATFSCKQVIYFVIFCPVYELVVCEASVIHEKVYVYSIQSI